VRGLPAKLGQVVARLAASARRSKAITRFLPVSAARGTDRKQTALRASSKTTSRTRCSLSSNPQWARSCARSAPACRPHGRQAGDRVGDLVLDLRVWAATSRTRQTWSRCGHAAWRVPAPSARALRAGAASAHSHRASRRPCRAFDSAAVSPPPNRASSAANHGAVGGPHPFGLVTAQKGKGRLDCGQERRLVLVHRQQVVPAPGADV
jgi:hypothetical protein